MNISQHEEKKKNKKVGKKTNVLSEEIGRVKMRSPSLVNMDYFLSNLQFPDISLIESVPELIEG